MKTPNEPLNPSPGIQNVCRFTFAYPVIPTLRRFAASVYESKGLLPTPEVHLPVRVNLGIPH